MSLFKKPKQPVQRQRTYTGASRSSAFSYHANRLEQDYNLGRQQPRDQDVRRREKLLRYWRQRLGVLVAGFIIIVCLIDILQLSPNPKVVPLTTSSTGSFLQATSVYQAAASKLFSSSLFNGNKITINTGQIASQLQKQYPELSAVSVTLPLIGHRPIVYIAPATPSLILTAHNGNFVVDSNGRALLAASQVDAVNSLKLPVLTDQSGLHVATGQAVLPSDSVSFVQTVAAELKAKGTAIKSMTLPATTAYELDVQPGGVGYYIKFNLHTSDAMQQVGTYIAVQQRLKAQSITPTSYIDVRVDGRAYYK